MGASVLPPGNDDRPGRTTVAADAVAGQMLFGFVGAGWQIESLSVDCSHLLGCDPAEAAGARLMELVHADDVPGLIMAVGRSAEDRRGAWTAARLRHASGDWVPVRMLVSPLAGVVPPPFAFAAFPSRPQRDTGAADRVAALEHHLRAIAQHLHDAGVLEETAGADSGHVAVLAELTERQREVVRRLLRGQRVSTIAREMFLSQSAIRNHLAVVYARLGVHSQAELLEALTGASGAG